MGHGVTKDEKETNIRDLDAPEAMKFTQVQPSDRVQLKQSEETQRRNLKETPKNIGNQSYNSCNQCDYVTDRKNKLINHLQDHHNGLKRNKQYKTENEMQIEKDVRFLKQEESSQKNISREGGKDSDIENPKLPEYKTDPKAAEMGFA